MAGLGELNVKVGLDAAEFTRGLTRAERDAQRFQANLVKLGAQIGTALGVGFVAASTAIGVLTKKSIDAQDKLYDLSMAAGISVENLGGIGFAAAQAGSSLEAVTSSFGKLNVRIAEAARGEKEATEAFKALGIAVKDAAGNTRAADAIFKDVATAFESFEDGPEKAALGMALFGKSYQQMLPLLADGGKKLQENIDYFNKYGGITTETAKKSSEFNDTLGKLAVQAEAFGNALVKEMIGPLQAVADEMLNVAEQSTLLTDAAKLAGDVFVFFVDKIANAVTNLRIAGIYVGEFAAKVRAIGEGNLPGSVQFDAISKAAREDVNRAISELDRFKRALQNATAPRVTGIGLEELDALSAKLPSNKRSAPRLSGPTDKAKKDIDEYARHLEQLAANYRSYVQQLGAGLEREQQLSEVQKVTMAIEQQRFGHLIPQQKELLLLLAQQADAQEEYNEKIKENARVTNEAIAENERFKQSIDSLTGRSQTRQDLQALRDLDDALREGIITLEEYKKAQDRIAGFDKELEKTKDAAVELGLVFTSSIGDFIKQPTDGKTFFKALLEDVLQLTTQLLIMEPIMKSIRAASSGGSGSFDWAGLIGGLFGSGGSQNLSGVFASGTDFVPRDGPAFLHRGERVITAEDNRRGRMGGTNNIHIQFAGQATPATGSQIGASIARELAIHNRRNN